MKAGEIPKILRMLRKPHRSFEGLNVSFSWEMRPREYTSVAGRHVKELAYMLTWDPELGEIFGYRTTRLSLVLFPSS